MAIRYLNSHACTAPYSIAQHSRHNSVKRLAQCHLCNMLNWLFVRLDISLSDHLHCIAVIFTLLCIVAISSSVDNCALKTPHAMLYNYITHTYLHASVMVLSTEFSWFFFWFQFFSIFLRFFRVFFVSFRFASSHSSSVSVCLTAKWSLHETFMQRWCDHKMAT